MLGLSTYAYVWRSHQGGPHAFTLQDVFDDAVRLGVGLVQICDQPALEHADARWLREVQAQALGRGLVLETGTKGVEVEHLRDHLAKAVALGSTFVRSMVSSRRYSPTRAEATSALRQVMRDFDAAGVTLGLETYEQYATEDLVGIVEDVGSDSLGVCLDPGNAVARLEHPAHVARLTAPHVVNLHVKDFAFTRREGMIGFTFAGTPLGDGLLDYDAVVDALDAASRKVNHVVEHWLPFTESLDRTRELERQWVDGSVVWLKERGRT